MSAGMSELLEQGFLFRSMAADMYFVNVRFMFNGNRMVLVESDRRKGSATQAELPLNTPSALAAPDADAGSDRFPIPQTDPRLTANEINVEGHP
jgi:hypothetical protein